MNKEFELYTPVAYIIFNRPDCVRRSFESIRKARPKKLFISLMVRAMTILMKGDSALSAER